MLDSAPSGKINDEMSGDSCSAMSNGTNNHYDKHDAVYTGDDNDELNHFNEDAQHDEPSKSAKVPSQQQPLPDPDTDLQLAVDAETKENAMKPPDVHQQETDEMLEDWQILKVHCPSTVCIE